jgi:hypothetical protein
MVDSPMSIVLPSSKRNRIDSTGRGNYRCSYLRRASMQIGTLVSKMTFLARDIALLFKLHWVLSSLDPLDILISSNRGLEIIRVLNHLSLWGREFLSS